MARRRMLLFAAVGTVIHRRQVEATTIAGLVGEAAGRIPHSGETVEHDGLQFELLESTDRRIERVRVGKLAPPPLRQHSLSPMWQLGRDGRNQLSLSFPIVKPSRTLSSRALRWAKDLPRR